MSHEPQETRTSGKAIASLVLGIASFVCSIFTGIPAIILAILGLRDISQSDGRIKGQGLAIAGIVTSVVTMVILVPAILIGLLLPAVQKVREAANRMNCQNNLKQMVLAMHNYHSAHGRLPPAAVYDKDGKPLYSWRVLLLPYLEQQSLYRQFKLDEPWDSPNNAPLIGLMPKVYADPSADLQRTGDTTYQVIVGPGAAFESPEGQRLADFVKGTSNTLLIVEAAEAVPWTKPADLPYGPNLPLPRFGSQHAGGFNAALADGSVRFFEMGANEQVLRGMITRNGKEGLQRP